MKVIADLHLHSKYSRAVSPQMIPATMNEWAKLKGIDLLGTGDWTHPLWLKELESQLQETENGIFSLKSQISSTKIQINSNVPNSKLQKEIKFLLSTEISSIYSQGGKGRRIHNLVLAPSFKTVYKINDELKRRGCNLLSDGRPIIGLSSIQLCELVWTIDESCLIISCHAWTPWFSLYGSKSGFDSIEECFGQFSKKIYAVETGLSSDPEMNWRIKELDTRSIVSFGDSHSPAKLGREATVFELEELSFDNISQALRLPALLGSRIKFDPVFESPQGGLLRSPGQNFFSSNRTRKESDPSNSSRRDTVNMKKENFCQAPRNPQSNRILYTIEFYPEEGKYHYSGHRNCGIKQSPKETKEKGTICSVCGRVLTLGVMHRVEELGTREVKVKKMISKNGLMGYYDGDNHKRPPFVKLVPLMEIIAESMKSTVASLKVKLEYERLTKNLAPEFELLTKTSLEKIHNFSSGKIAEGIKKVRIGDISVDPGFDGVFGVVKIWPASPARLDSAKRAGGSFLDGKQGIKNHGIVNKEEQISMF